MANNPALTIEVDPGPAADSDSAYGDELASYTTSLSSSVANHLWKHGRRYHSYREEQYPLPNDEKEQDRLDMFHHMVTLALDGRLYLAPISGDSALRVLDIGTGTGIWAMEMGDNHPSYEIRGNDLSPIQPPWVPVNVSFEVDDCESPWPQRPPFDFIHSRYMAGSIADWPRLIRRCHANLKNGGWVEFQDLDLHHYSEDDSIPAGDRVLEMHELIVEACEKMGRTVCPGKRLKGWVEDAGFRNVHHEIFKVPFGTWPKNKRLKEIGAFHMTQFVEGLEAFALQLFTGALGWSHERVQVYLAGVREDAGKKSVHMMMNFHVVYAQK